MRSVLVRFIFGSIAITVAIAVIGLALLLLAMRFDNGRTTVLPEPTGVFRVGRTNMVLTDSNSTDAMASEMSSARKLYMWAWYPASVQASAKHAPYLPSAWRDAREAHSGWLITRLVNRSLANVQAHSIADAPLSTAKPSYPVVLLRAGSSASTTDYTVLAEDLASHGYVVLGIDAPYRTFIVVDSDGRVTARAPSNNPDLYRGAALITLATKLANAWAEDLSFMLNQLEALNAAKVFAGRLDLKRVGVVGHSLGGATALQFCRNDARCAAGIDLDGLPLGTVIATGLNKPFLFLLSDHAGEYDTDNIGQLKNVLADIEAIYARLPADARHYLMMRGANHYNFSDGAVLKSPPIMKLLSAFGIVRLDGRRQLELTASAIRRFFDVYIKHDGETLSFSMSEYPEIDEAP